MVIGLGCVAEVGLDWSSYQRSSYGLQEAGYRALVRGKSVDEVVSMLKRWSSLHDIGFSPVNGEEPSPKHPDNVRRVVSEIERLRAIDNGAPKTPPPDDETAEQKAERDRIVAAWMEPSNAAFADRAKRQRSESIRQRLEQQRHITDQTSGPVLCRFGWRG